MNNLDIWKKIRWKREELNISQEELGWYLGISRIAVGNIETGKRKVKDSEMQQICDFFELPLSFFKEKINTYENQRPLKDLILYIANKLKDSEAFWKTTLNKLLYFSDFNYYEWTWSLITNTTYKKLPYWPVPSDISSTLEEMVLDWEIAILEENYHGYTKQKIVALRDNREQISLNLFRNTDIQNRKSDYNYTPYDDLPQSKKIVDDVIEKYGNWNASKISDLSHEDTPYLVTKSYWDTIKPSHVFYRTLPFIVNHHNLDE